jgi:hypothetical protein
MQICADRLLTCQRKLLKHKVTTSIMFQASLLIVLVCKIRSGADWLAFVVLTQPLICCTHVFHQVLKDTPTRAPTASRWLYSSLCKTRAAAESSTMAAGGEQRWALAIHGGAGVINSTNTEWLDDAKRGLEASLRAGEAVLASGGSAMDAVVAAVESMENDPHFNAGWSVLCRCLGVRRGPAHCRMLNGCTLSTSRQ